MKIQFLGATRTVTGSKYLLHTSRSTIMADCGLFQGRKDLRLRNWAPLPIHPASIHYILLTHAHIDHSGYIPLLVRNGFRGKILCSEATRDLCAILLPDSGHLQEEEALFASKHGYSRHTPPKPLYTEAEARAALKYFWPVPVGRPVVLHSGCSATFHHAGHILGACFVRIEERDSSILFSGDLGRPRDPLLHPPEAPPESGFIVVESTYGNRQHGSLTPEKQLQEIINRTSSRGGSILIPSFAVGRTQSILWYLHQLKARHAIADLPVYIDSPMATDATMLLRTHASEHRLTPEQCRDVCKVAQYIRTVEESKALNHQHMPMIILSASGMATGGRVLHHLRRMLPDHRNAIVFAGFQASGTRGDRLVRGEQAVRMFGEMVPVRAEVTELENMSAHADSDEVLQWLEKHPGAPRKVFVTHGEPESALALCERIQSELRWNAEVPEYLQTESLGS